MPSLLLLEHAPLYRYHDTQYSSNIAIVRLSGHLALLEDLGGSLNIAIVGQEIRLKEYKG